jgi:hypothetical protein
MSEDYKMVTFSDGKRKTYEKIIKEKTAEKKRELSRSLDNRADGLMKKDYPQFLKAIKVKKDLELLKKATTELKNFERSIENKRQLLQDNQRSIAKKLTAICERQANINGFDEYFGHSDDFDDFDHKLQKVCRNEIVKKLRKSTKEGQELDAIDNRVDNILLTLSYPNLKAKAVDLNNALASSESMLSFALNPNTLKLTNGTQ